MHVCFSVDALCKLCCPASIQDKTLQWWLIALFHQHLHEADKIIRVHNVVALAGIGVERQDWHSRAISMLAITMATEVDHVTRALQKQRLHLSKLDLRPQVAQLGKSP
mmetsp:Transcript_26841/g.79081  ORF Transcript_26841/g.79081 Transcript_26841/m.79081 type:complete len:108 (+) Transcript_26841:1552-1875(+)